VRILLDECLPARLALELTGHQATTVRRSGWTGLKNGELLRRAGRKFDVFLTIDQSIWHQQDIPPALALITLQASSHRFEALRPLVPAILQTLEAISKGQSTRIRA
jgi:predicted nuclease of predicted toxin-antitoxin system